MAAAKRCDLVESWEELEDTELLTRLDPPTPEETEIISTGPVTGQIIFQDEKEYGASVKILKRPPKHLETNQEKAQINGDLKPRQPVKTLQQREQEYAEARLRILGEARSPEEQPQAVSSDRICKIQPKMEILRLSDAAPTNVIRLPKAPDGTRGFIRR